MQDYATQVKRQNDFPIAINDRAPLSDEQIAGPSNAPSLHTDIHEYSSKVNLITQAIRTDSGALGEEEMTMAIDELLGQNLSKWQEFRRQGYNAPTLQREKLDELCKWAKKTVIDMAHKSDIQLIQKAIATLSDTLNRIWAPSVLTSERHGLMLKRNFINRAVSSFPTLETIVRMLNKLINALEGQLVFLLQPEDGSAPLAAPMISLTEKTMDSPSHGACTAGVADPLAVLTETDGDPISLESIPLFDAKSWHTTFAEITRESVNAALKDANKRVKQIREYTTLGAPEGGRWTSLAEAVQTTSVAMKTVQKKTIPKTSERIKQVKTDFYHGVQHLSQHWRKKSSQAEGIKTMNPKPEQTLMDNLVGRGKMLGNEAKQTLNLTVQHLHFQLHNGISPVLNGAIYGYGKVKEEVRRLEKLPPLEWSREDQREFVRSLVDGFTARTDHLGASLKEGFQLVADWHDKVKAEVQRLEKLPPLEWSREDQREFVRSLVDGFTARTDHLGANLKEGFQLVADWHNKVKAEVQRLEKLPPLEWSREEQREFVRSLVDDFTASTNRLGASLKEGYRLIKGWHAKVRGKIQYFESLPLLEWSREEHREFARKLNNQVNVLASDISAAFHQRAEKIRQVPTKIVESVLALESSINKPFKREPIEIRRVHAQRIKDFNASSLVSGAEVAPPEVTFGPHRPLIPRLKGLSLTLLDMIERLRGAIQDLKDAHENPQNKLEKEARKFSGNACITAARVMDKTTEDLFLAEIIELRQIINTERTKGFDNRKKKIKYLNFLIKHYDKIADIASNIWEIGHYFNKWSNAPQKTSCNNNGNTSKLFHDIATLDISLKAMKLKLNNQTQRVTGDSVHLNSRDGRLAQDAGKEAYKLEMEILELNPETDMALFEETITRVMEDELKQLSKKDDGLMAQRFAIALSNAKVGEQQHHKTAEDLLRQHSLPLGEYAKQWARTKITSGPIVTAILYGDKALERIVSTQFRRKLLLPYLRYLKILLAPISIGIIIKKMKRSVRPGEDKADAIINTYVINEIAKNALRLVSFFVPSLVSYTAALGIAGYGIATDNKYRRSFLSKAIKPIPGSIGLAGGELGISFALQSSRIYPADVIREQFKNSQAAGIAKQVNIEEYEPVEFRSEYSIAELKAMEVVYEADLQLAENQEVSESDSSIGTRHKRDYGMEFNMVDQSIQERETKARIEREKKIKETDRRNKLCDAKNKTIYSVKERNMLLDATLPNLQGQNSLDAWLDSKWNGLGVEPSQVNYRKRINRFTKTITFGTEEFLMPVRNIANELSIENRNHEAVLIEYDEGRSEYYLVDEKNIDELIPELLKKIETTADIHLRMKNEMRILLYENKTISIDRLFDAIGNGLLIEFYSNRHGNDISYLYSILKAKRDIRHFVRPEIRVEDYLYLDDRERTLLKSFFGVENVDFNGLGVRLNKYFKAMRNIKIDYSGRSSIHDVNSETGLERKKPTVDFKNEIEEIIKDVDGIINGLYINSSSIKDDFLLINKKSIPKGIDWEQATDSRHSVEYLSNFIFFINNFSRMLDDEDLIYDISSQIQSQLLILVEDIEKRNSSEGYEFVKYLLCNFKPITPDIEAGEFYNEALYKYVWGLDSEEEALRRLKTEIDETSRRIQITEEEISYNNNTTYRPVQKLMFRADMPSTNINYTEAKERDAFEEEKKKRNDHLILIKNNLNLYLEKLNKILTEQSKYNEAVHSYFSKFINDMRLFHSIDFSKNTSSFDNHKYWRAMITSEINIATESLNNDNIDSYEYHLSKAKYIQYMMALSKEYKELISFFSNENFLEVKDSYGDYRDILKSKSVANSLIKKSDNFKDKNIDHVSSLLYYMMKYNLKSKSEISQVNPQDIFLEYYRDLRELNPIAKDELPPEGYYSSHFFRRQHFSSQYEFNEQFNIYEKKYSKYESIVLSRYLYASVAQNLSIGELQETPKNVLRFKLDKGSEENVLYVITRKEECILVWHVDNKFTIEVKKEKDVPNFLKNKLNSVSINIYPNIGVTSGADLELGVASGERAAFMKNYNFGEIVPSFYGTTIEFGNKSTLAAFSSVAMDIFNNDAEKQKLVLDHAGFWHRCAVKLIPMYEIIYKEVTDSSHTWRVSEIADIVSTAGILLTLGVSAGIEITEILAKNISNSIMEGVVSGENRFDMLIKIIQDNELIKKTAGIAEDTIYSALDILINPMPISARNMFELPYKLGDLIEKRVRFKLNAFKNPTNEIDKKFEVLSSTNINLVPADKVFGSNLNSIKYNGVYFDRNSANDFYITNNKKLYRVRWGGWENSWRLIDPQVKLKFRWTPAVKYEGKSGWVIHDDFALKGGAPEPAITSVPIATADDILKKEWEIRESYKELPYSAPSEGLNDIISLERSLDKECRNTLFFDYNLHSIQSEYVTVYRVEVTQPNDKYMHTDIDKYGNVQIYVPGMEKYPSNRDLRINSDAKKLGWYTASKDYIAEKRGKIEGNTAWYNFGNPIRALQFYEQKMENVQEKLPFTIKSFRIRSAVFKAIAEDCIIERDKKKYTGYDPSLNVDKKAYNQIGLRPHHLRLLSQSIIPNSGKIYSPDEFYKLTDVGLQNVSKKKMKIPRKQ